jgi:hypothetical protein
VKAVCQHGQARCLIHHRIPRSNRDRHGLGYGSSTRWADLLAAINEAVGYLEAVTSKERPADASSSEWVKHCLERLDGLEVTQIDLFAGSIGCTIA